MTASEVQVLPVSGESLDGQPPWTVAQRLAFRFIFSYIVLYIFPFPLGAFPGQVGFPLYQRLWRTIVPWVGEHVLGYSRQAMTIFPAGSGDTLFNYVQLACHVIVALASALIWTLLDRRRKGYRMLQEGLRIYVRYFLAFMMLVYGMNKVVKLQFPDPSLQKLAQPFGSYSPFSLLWNFMGSSALYTHFSGAGEVLGGLLLFFRRTTTLGALVICGVMIHVLVLNLSYDVPVKIHAFHLVLFGMYLVGPDLARLANMLVLNRPVPAGNIAWPFATSRRARVIRIGAKVVVLIFLVGLVTVMVTRISGMQASVARSPLYGIYQVEAFTRNGAPVQGSRAELWRLAVFDYRQFMNVIAIDDSMRNYRTEYDEKAQTLTLSDPRQKGKQIGTLTYSRSDKERVTLQGTFMDQPVVIHLTNDASKFLLRDRGFHWVSDSPYAR